MNRIIEVVAMAVGGTSLFLVCFVGFTALSGRDVSQVAVIGKLFPAKGDEAPEDVAVPEVEPKREMSDAAVVEASLGVLSAWTLPSPYSTSELRVLVQELESKRAELARREEALAKRERTVADDEQELAERLATLEELRAELERVQLDLEERRVVLGREEDAAAAGANARWSEVAGVLGVLDEPEDAAKKLQEYPPADAAKILRALGDDDQAGEILNAVAPARWKEYVDAYTAEKARAKPAR
jgi:flagellar motility protein MotE (MotC chaperone)